MAIYHADGFSDDFIIRFESKDWDMETVVIKTNSQDPIKPVSPPLPVFEPVERVICLEE
jgi:hypothetical protein